MGGVYQYDLEELTSVSSGLATLKADYENTCLLYTSPSPRDS